MEKAVFKWEKRKMKMAELGESSCLPDLSGEGILQNRLHFHLGEEEEIYEGYGRVANAYPYRRRNAYTRRLQEREYRAAVLENAYLRAVFLPEYGGRLWELYDKQRNRNLLYTNDVLRFGNLAVRNAWFSGGVEWNIGIIGHCPFTTEQLYLAVTEDPSGNPLLRMYEYERIRGLKFQMDFWLEDAGLYARMRVMNESRELVPMYWWSNIAVPEHEGGRLIVPADSAYTSVGPDIYKCDIPMVKGLDVTAYKNIPNPVDYFFSLREDSPKYIAGIDAQGYGLLHLSTGRLQSRKLFSWGKQIASDNWQAFLTENAGRYIEIQAGLGKTQYGCIPMAPNTAWEWMERYGALQLPKDKVELAHAERYAYVNGFLAKEKLPEKLEQKLRLTKETVLKKAELLLEGSGYGILAEKTFMSAHLEFCDKEGRYRHWKDFMEGEDLGIPSAAKRPDAYIAGEKVRKRLEEAVKGHEAKNWYAHYHLGIQYYLAEDYRKARKEWKQSLDLCENAWAYHGLACLALLHKKNKKAQKYILQGMHLQKEVLSYLKEGFRILLGCGAYKELSVFYESLSPVLREDSRLRFGYITALGKAGREKEAYGLLTGEKAFVLEDIREGEDSVAELWTYLHEKIYGERKEAPPWYRFHIFQ